MEMNAESLPKTLIQAIRHFSDYENCDRFLVGIRWPSGEVSCPSSGCAKVRYIQTRRQWECSENHPKRRFSLKTGTIMEDSPLPLEKWLAALWLEVNSKNSVSSYEAHRALGVTQKSAWFMLHRLRTALRAGSLERIGGNGPIEADETYVGGLARNMHFSRRGKTIKGTGPAGKTIVMGLLGRHSGKRRSQFRTEVVKNNDEQTLHAIIHKNVVPGSEVFTDSLASYRGLDPQFLHDFVDHAEKYVDGIVHTNGMENFWALFKRCIKGTHISIDPAHLHRYLDSEGFRFNNRDTNDCGRFNLAAPGIIGRRLTYKALTGALEGGTAHARTR